MEPAGAERVCQGQYLLLACSAALDLGKRGVPTLSGVRLQALLAKLLSVHISRHTFSEGLVASAMSLVLLS